MDKATLRFLYRGWKSAIKSHRLETRAMQAFLKKDDIAIDVGANKGSFLPALAKAVPHGQVFAFEAQPELGDYLARILVAAKIGNVTVIPKGVSDHAGTLQLSIPGDSGPSPGASFEVTVADKHSQCRTVDVPVCSLDEYFTGETAHIGAIKIDVEGHEFKVLRGAEHILKTHRPIIVCECEERHLGLGGVQQLLDYLKGLGYSGYFVNRSRLEPLSQFDVTRHQPTVGEQFWKKKGYCNNFIMTPTNPQ